MDSLVSPLKSFSAKSPNPSTNVPRHRDTKITLDELRYRLHSRVLYPPQVNSLHTFAIYEAVEILPYIGKGMERVPVLHRGRIVEVKTTSHRLACFKRSRVCVRCGRVGTIFLLQANRITPYLMDSHGLQKPHLNLYHVDETDRFHLMTHDHIIPRALGGPDCMENVQTMCGQCNFRKGCTPE